jgi:hypothetical protein
MNYPINVSDYIDIDFAMNLILFAILAMALIALWFDLRYKPQVYDLVTLLDRRVSSRASEIFKQKLRVTFSESILTQQDYDLKYSLENQAEEIKKSLKSSKYKPFKGVIKETYTGGWIKAEFKQPKKEVKPPYFSPVKTLSLEESREIKVGSIELEKVYAENNT